MRGPDVTPLPPNVALRLLSITVASFVSFGFVTKYAFVADRPTVPREHPFSGLVTELGGLKENQVSSLLDDYQTPAFGRVPFRPSSA
jgi:NADH dehydrogenase (ubiquinone) 1 beta subcomplex subunit 8